MKTYKGAILLVENDPSSLELLTGVLTNEGYKVY